MEPAGCRSSAGGPNQRGKRVTVGRRRNHRNRDIQIDRDIRAERQRVLGNVGEVVAWHGGLNKAERPPGADATGLASG